MNNALKCWVCGVAQGLAQQRRDWRLHLMRPHDLLCDASVYRNAGNKQTTHICDRCLSVALRALKVRINDLLGELDADHDKDTAIVDLTEQLGRLQHRHHNVCFDHNRMQERLKDILPPAQDIEPEALRMARWEANRAPAKETGAASHFPAPSSDGAME